MADKYPEHEKLSAVKEESQTIGEFLDLGLPQMGLMLYEKRLFDCECDDCEEGKGGWSRWHSKAERATAVDGCVRVERWVPTYKTINAILAVYFGIDQAKIDAEKEQMLDNIRAAEAS